MFFRSLPILLLIVMFTPSAGMAAAKANIADPTRLFLAAVIGRDKPSRRAHAADVLAAVDRAIERDPDDLSLMMLKSAALGTAARASSFSESVAERYGSRSDTVIEELKERAPDHPWTLTLSGLWNFEVQRRGGSIGATILGASTEQGVADLDRALSLAGRQDPAIAFAYAVVLLSYDAEAYAARARKLLQVSELVAGQQPQDDPVVQAIATPLSMLLDALDNPDFDALEERAINSF